MDEYLDEDASYKRLKEEYDKYGSLVIGYDFDGTVHDFHKTGASHKQVIQLLNDLKGIGCRMICWTAHPDLTYVLGYTKENDIPCDGVNCTGISLAWESRKPMFSALLDDRAGLIQVYKDLSRLVKEIKQ